MKALFSCAKSSSNLFLIFVNRIAAEGCTVSTYFDAWQVSLFSSCNNAPINTTIFGLTLLLAAFSGRVCKLRFHLAKAFGCWM